MPSRRRAKPRKKAPLDQLGKAELLRDFVAKQGWDAIRDGTVVKGVHLYTWKMTCTRAYRLGRLSPSLIRALKAIPGWSWGESPLDQTWRKLELLQQFVRRHGLDALRHDTLVDGVDLYGWCYNRRTDFRLGKLEPWLAREIEAIPGWSWHVMVDRYATRIVSIRKHVAKHGWPKAHQLRPGVEAWVNHLRAAHGRGELHADHRRALEAIPGWSDLVRSRAERNRERVVVLRRFVARHGFDSLKAKTIVDGVPIGSWVLWLRKRRRDKRLPRWLAHELEAVPGWRWPRGGRRGRGKR